MVPALRLSFLGLCALGACRRPLPAHTTDPSHAQIRNTETDTDVADVTDATDATGPTQSPRDRFPSGGAKLVGSMLYLLTADFLTLEARELETGALRWSLRFQDHASGLHQLYVRDPETLWVHAGSTLYVFSLTRGTLEAQHPTLPSRNDDHAYLRVRHGACAFRSSCSLQWSSCATGEAWGPVVNGHIIYRQRYDSMEHDRGCWGEDPTLVGLANGLGLMVAYPNEQPELLAFAQGETTPRYRVALPDLHPAMDTVEQSPDGRLCWWLDTHATVHVLRCDTGESLWHKAFPGAAPATENALLGLHSYWVSGPQEGIFLSTLSFSWLFGSSTGALRWKRAVSPVPATVLPLGVVLGEDPVFAQGSRLVLVEPTQGRPVETFPIPTQAALTAFETGFRVEDTDLAFDAQGHRVAASPQDYGEFQVLHQTDHRCSIQYKGRELEALAFDAEELGEWTTPTEHFLALYVWNASAPGEVRVLRVPRASP